ncbi:MAG: HAMP domain-containing sensor histidine kinase, partial [Candidatus Saccharimonadales bacterium]
MRTPVAAIEGYLGLALNPQTATIDDKARMYLTKAHESAEHLGQLFQDLLDVSKAEDGRLSSNPTAIDVTSFARDVTSSLQSKAINNQISLVFAPDTNDPANQTITPVYYVNADPNHYREVLANLIENGIKYTKSSGTVTVDISGDETHVIISIIDNGLGIPTEDISHLFQKFYRVDNTDTREIGGTGLGLYLCRRLVESMDGRIWVESVYGKGSMFFVELPRMNNDQALQQIQASQQQQ